MTRSIEQVTNAIVETLGDAWEDFGMLDRDQVFFGDEFRYPKVPAIGVEPGPRESPLTATGMMQTHTFTVYAIIYSGAISGDLQSIKRRNIELAEIAERVINANTTLGGLIIHGHVVNVEPGFANVGGELFVASRLTWSGLSRSVVGGD